MKNRQFSITKLFYNNKFVLFFSIIASFIIWLSFASGSTESLTKTIDGIRVDISLSDEAKSEGLIVFSGDDITAEVTVTGNRVTIGSLSKSDIQIVAENAGSITRPGNYTLNLRAKKTGLKNDYEIASSVYPSSVTVYVDRFRELEFNIEDGMEYKVNDKYFASAMTFSTGKVVVSGPETDISKVKRVAVIGTIEEELSKTWTGKKQIVLYDAYGSRINNSLITTDVTTVDVSIPLLAKKTLPIDIEYINKPDGVDISEFVTISPPNLEIAATDEAFKEIGDKLMLKSVDFSQLLAKENKFTFTPELPVGCKNIDSSENITVTIDLSKMSQRTYTVTKFEFTGLDDNHQATTTNSLLSVNLIGLPSELNKIRNSDLTAIIDLSSKSDSFVGTTEVPISSFRINNGECNCWALGSYNVYIKVSEKTLPVNANSTTSSNLS